MDNTHNRVAGRSPVLVVMGAISVGCAVPAEDGLALTKYQEVQAAFVGTSGTTPPVLINRNWGSIEKATGAVRPAGKFWADDDIAGNCGATFVTATHAVTAAHCVTAEMTPNGEVRIEQINASGLTNTKFRSQDDVSIQPGYSEWPFYWRANTLSSSDGYVVNNGNGPMDCYVKRRCDVAYGPLIDCDPNALNSPYQESDLDEVDIAVLECPSRVSIMGNDAKSVTLASSDDGNTSDDGDFIEVFWFHEVVDLYAGSGNGGSTTPYNNFVHYLWYDYDELGENYHYYTKHQNHQLIPLRSRWRNGIRYKSLGFGTGVYNKEVNTNVPICHGTSGSGAFKKRGSDGAIHYLGPMRTGSYGDLPGHLCHDMWDTTAISRYIRLKYTTDIIRSL